MAKNDDFFKSTDARRTDVYCHGCTKTFIARIHFEIDGNHIIHCPYCGHEHCRAIKDGEVTKDRWDSRNNTRIDVPRSDIQVWEHTHVPAQTSTASHFLRDKWINRSDS